ncbi:ABC transporter substrate-binding protein [Bradyrhizobium jicamae]|uniref:ABC transporter substrate-binding protein n=1 Tax=Bradyrhizobium jicamae TaxID=280332 RepID=UPI001BACB0F0|nr:ABC transporter substrate-binding protein [Bradyrhizobium jicamae]MBR0937407.1 ABC transporter substrate-binding protein [Bradyrhizobium jicamae]
MRRRDFIAFVGAAVTVGSSQARAQQPGRIYRIGSLHQGALTDPHHLAFYDELRSLGFIEGQNVASDREGYGLKLDELATHASTLAKSSVDVILCGGDVAIRAAREATTTTPIIAVTDDMVRPGFVRTLAKPGGNVTGISILATELDGKREEILVEAVPGILRVAALADPATTSSEQSQALQKLSEAQGVELSIHWAAKVDAIADAIDAAYHAQAQAINVLATPLLFNNRQIILDRVRTLRLPAIYQWPETAEEGGFTAYGPRFTQMYRQAAQLVAKVFNGTKPADIPVEQPTRFELVVNLKTARAIGHEIPAALVLRSDKVIE